MKGSELRKTTFEIFHIQGILKNQNNDKTRICEDMSLHIFYSNFLDSTACFSIFSQKKISNHIDIKGLIECLPQT